MILTEENYFSKEAETEYMSVSQFKLFSECQAKAMAALNGEYVRPDIAALLVGSYVDAHFSGTLDLFIAKHPEILKRDGTLKAEYINAGEIIKRIERDELFMDYLLGEDQVIMTGEIEGIKVKIKIDSLHPDRIVDLKIMRDFEPIYKPGQGRLPWFEAWGYDLQGAVYREIVRQNTGEVLPFYLAAATKEKVTDIDIVKIGDDLLDYELDVFRKKAPFFDAIKKGVFLPERCEKCDWCKETKVLKRPRDSKEFIDE